MTLSFDQKVRNYLIQYPQSPIDRLYLHPEFKNKIEAVARFWIKAFGFFYASSLQHGSLKNLRYHIQVLQKEIITIYQACESGHFDGWIKNQLSQASYYKGDDIGQMRQGKLYTLVNLPFPLAHTSNLLDINELQMSELDQNVLVRMQEEEFKADQIRNRWVCNGFCLEAFSEEEKAILERHIFSKAAIIWNKNYYNWYQIIQVWFYMHPELKPKAFDTYFPMKALCINPQHTSLQEDIVKILKKEWDFLSTLSFQQIVTELSIRSLSDSWQVQFSVHMQKHLRDILAKDEILRQQALLSSHQLIRTSHNRLNQSVEMFVSLRNLLTENLDIEGSPFSYDTILGWIHLAGGHLGKVSFARVRPGHLRFIFDIIEQWEKGIDLPVEECFFIFQLAAYNTDFTEFVQKLKQAEKTCKLFCITPDFLREVLQLESRTGLKEAFEGIAALDSLLHMMQVDQKQISSFVWLYPFQLRFVAHKMDQLKRWIISFQLQGLLVSSSTWMKKLEIILKSDKAMTSCLFSQISSFLPLSFDEKLEVACHLLQIDEEQVPSFVFQSERIIRLLKDEYHVPSFLLKYLFLHLMKIRVQDMERQLAFIEKIEGLIGQKLSGVSVFVWLAFCPNLEYVSQAVDTFIENCFHMANRINEPLLPLDQVTEIYTGLGVLVETPSSLREWKKLWRPFFQGLDPAQLQDYPDFEPVVTLGLDFAYRPMFAEVMTLLTYAIFPMGGHLWFTDFLCPQALRHEPFIIGEEEKREVISHALIPLLEANPNWKGIYRQWNLPSDKNGYPLFTLSIIDFQTGSSVTIQEKLLISLKELEKDQSVFQTIQQMANKLGSEMQEDLFEEEQNFTFCEEIKTFSYDLKVKLRAALFQLNPFFQEQLSANAPSMLYLSYAHQHQDRLVKEIASSLKIALDQDGLEKEAIIYEGIDLQIGQVICLSQMVCIEDPAAKIDNLIYVAVTLKTQNRSQQVYYTKTMLQDKAEALIRWHLDLLRYAGVLEDIDIERTL